MTRNVMTRGIRLCAVPAVVAVAAVAMIACGGGPRAGFPGAPDETVRYVADQLGDHHPEVLWEAMPAGYREDVTELVHRYAEKTDPEMYDKGFALARKTVQILRDKKDIILGSSTFRGVVKDDRETVAQQWDSVVGVLETIVESDVSSLEKMQTIDIGAFLADTGARVMQQAAEASEVVEDDPYEKEFQRKLAEMQVETVSLNGDTAILKITVPDEQSEELTLVRVEDRWVPKELADQWDRSMAEAREKLAQLDEEKSADTKMQAMMMMGMAEAFLDQIAAVETSEELDRLLQGMLGGMLSGRGKGPAPFQK